MPVDNRAIAVLRHGGHERASITYKGQHLLHTRRHGKFNYDGSPVKPPRNTVFGSHDPRRLILPSFPEWEYAVEYMEYQEKQMLKLRRAKLCSHCNNPVPYPHVGTVMGSGYPQGIHSLCHSDDRDCFRLVTVYQHPLDCPCNGSIPPEDYNFEAALDDLLNNM